MKTPLGVFPFGTLSGTILSYTLASLYGTLVLGITIVKICVHRGKYLVPKKREIPPKLALDKRFGEHNFAQLNNVKLHYVANGSKHKPLMLFLHGFPEVWFSWRYQLEEFAKDYYVVAVDMRGYGDSDKPKGVANYSLDKLVTDVNELISALGKEKAILVAHDWGGLVAWTVAAYHSQKIEKLIIMNAPPVHIWLELIEKDWGQFFMSWYVFFFNVPYLPELYLKSMDFRLFDTFFTFRKKKYASDEEIDVYKYYYGKPNATTAPINYYRAVQRGYAADYWARLSAKKLLMPTLVIWGANDKALSLSLAHNCSSFADNFQLKIVDNCSHWTPFHQPTIVNKHMREFLGN